MQYRRMGRSGLKLSEVAVGSWMTDLKGREACDTAKEVLRRAYDRKPVWRKLWKL